MSTSPLAEFDHAAQEAAKPHSGKRLSLHERALILKARSRTPPPTVAEIANTLGCAESSVYRVLASAKLEVAPLLATYADDAIEMFVRAADKAADKGYTQGAERLLLYANKLEPLADPKHAANAVAVQVNVALSPGTPTFAPPPELTLDVVAQPAPTLTAETLPALTLDVKR